MAITENELCDFIVRRAEEEWHSKQYPYLLARLSPELRSEKDASYKDIVSPLTLKQFIEKKFASKVAIVVHPAKRAKIGVIPYGKRFSFLDGENPRYETSQPLEAVHESHRSGDKDLSFYNKRTVTQFITLIGRLDKEDLERIVIPVDVISKLINMP